MKHPLDQRYGGLSAYLTAQAARGETRVTLPFAVIETTLLGRPLPATARHPRGHRQWWRGRGTNYPHGWYGWQRVGWTLAAVDLAAETVTFTRDGGGGE
jgi:hypothetical protein